MSADARLAAEAWFEDHGLPYFVTRHRVALHQVLRPVRLVVLASLAALLGVAVGMAVGWPAGSVSAGVVAGITAVLLLALLYGATALRLRTMAGWALRRTFGSLGLMFPLVTRALPLLLLFITFLFINTEVWQVASAMSRPILWLAVLLFAIVTVVFLLVRLPEEVRRVEAEVGDDRLEACCANTPMAPFAAGMAVDARTPRLPALPRLNLVLVLLFNQLLQVLLLALTVFGFFIVFGLVAIDDDVIASWVGEGAPSPLPALGAWLPVSNELFQVAVFLAAFSGLYFTVYAVTDETYRRQFFTAISQELEQAIGIYAVYQRLAEDGRDSGPP